MNALVRPEAQALAMTDTELLSVLQSSLYPGAAPTSIKMVIAYCRAAGLDPMQKPVHIVPMWDSKAKQMRDVVMPGVNMYRIQAARSNQFAGMSEPDFGPELTTTLDGQSITYPEWCRVTVRRLMHNGMIAEFTAREFWIENYAVKGGQEKSIAPNAMWTKRPRGQIAKCAAAQALRIAFPEIASAPTADEMEGKQLHQDELTERHMGAAEEVKPALPPYPAADFDKNLPAWESVIAKGKKSAADLLAMLSTKATFDESQRARILSIGAAVETPAPRGEHADFIAAMDSTEETQ